ncbi:MAG: dockerin type I repeat-containing protein [candidate division Zixibacteria bacterium]|nr:dockerin type I repeat-containing protein [candidate division Zixibacteria bacterium]
MLHHRNKLKFWLAGLLILATLFAAPIVSAQPVELEFDIGDIGIEAGLYEVKVPVYLTNYTETIAGFELMVQENRPDVTVLHWLIDTVGTLIGGWEYVHSENFDGYNTNVNIMAVANLANPPENTPGVSPQAGETPFFNLIAYVNDLDDTLPDQTVTYSTNPIYPFCPMFSNQLGQLIGIEQDTVCDSVYFLCEYWIEDTICLSWTPVQTPPYDSVSYECRNITVLDTNVVKLTKGSVTVMLSTCGDVNGNGDIDIADITALISYLYLHGNPPPVMRVANLNGSPDGTIDISDITHIIAALYIDHRELICPYVPPED